jgi:ssDNA-binding Zn-finger/Zn-ribbon topoisomerase 1
MPQSLVDIGRARRWPTQENQCQLYNIRRIKKRKKNTVGELEIFIFHIKIFLSQQFYWSNKYPYLSFESTNKNYEWLI